MDEWQVLRQKLKEAFRLVAEAHPEFVSEAYGFLEMNEDVLALETMCDNLYECGCGVPAGSVAKNFLTTQYIVRPP